MSLGTMTHVDKSAAVGPEFTDNVTQVGDSAYVAGGTTGLQAKLRALRGDQRTITQVVDQSVGSHYVVYDPSNDKLKVYVRTTGVELANGDDSGSTYRLAITSK